MTEQKYTSCSWCPVALTYTSLIGVAASTLCLGISAVIFTLDEMYYSIKIHVLILIFFKIFQKAR